MMKMSVVRQLNQMNVDFYNQVGDEFDGTRRSAWPGWIRLVDEMKIASSARKYRVLDLGCGNGRFGLFMAEILGTHLEYVGIDSDEVLLERAKERLLFSEVEYILYSNDLISDEWLSLNLGKFDLVVGFGLMHHVPGEDERMKLMKRMSQYLNTNGKMVVSLWRFDRLKNFETKALDTDEIGGKGIGGLVKSDLEDGDYLLSWGNQADCYRYCHLIDQAEIDRWLKEADCELVREYEADGYTGNMNRYLTLKKKVLAK